MLEGHIIFNSQEEYGDSITLRLNQENDHFPTSCLEENLNNNSSISPEISSSRNEVTYSQSSKVIVCNFSSIG